MNEEFDCPEFVHIIFDREKPLKTERCAPKIQWHKFIEQIYIRRFEKKPLKDTKYQVIYEVSLCFKKQANTKTYTKRKKHTSIKNIGN